MSGRVWDLSATCLSRVAFARLEDLPNQTKTFPGESFHSFSIFLSQTWIMTLHQKNIGRLGHMCVRLKGAKSL